MEEAAVGSILVEERINRSPEIGILSSGDVLR